MQQNKIWENTLVSAEGNLQRYVFLFLPELFITFARQKNVTYRSKSRRLKMRCARIWIHPLLNSKIRLDRTGAEIAAVLSSNCQQF